MKRILLAIVLSLLGVAAFGASKGYQQATSLSTSTAQGLPSIPTNPIPGSALITVESAGIRWRDDGTAPTSSVGMPVSSGQALCYAQDLNAFQMIGQAAGATVDVIYYNGKYCAF